MFKLCPTGQIIGLAAVITAEIALVVLYKKFLNNIENNM